MARANYPTLRRQIRPNGRHAAIVQVRGERVYLGEYGSAEAFQRYQALCAELDAGGRLPARAPDFTIVELCARFLVHAHEHYKKPDGTVSSEVGNFKSVVGILRELYGAKPVAEFGPLALKACRSAMVSRGWVRKTANAHTGRIRRLFRWGVENELVPETVYRALATVAGLRIGKTAAAPSRRVLPATDDQIEVIKQRVGHVVAAMIEVQRLTGARPGEVCILRPQDLDRSGKVWIYRPADHKNAWRDGAPAREIYIGPRGQAILAPFLFRKPEAFVFSPAEAERARHASCRTHRRQPNKKPATPRRIRDRYTTASYRRCIDRACTAAGVPTWAPNQLRHTRATELRKAYGLEIARLVLGHSDITTTQIYAEADRVKAMQAMGDVG